MSQSKRAHEVRELAKELLSATGEALTLTRLREAVAAKWFSGNLSKVRNDYLLTTLLGHGSSVMFIIEGDIITVTTAMPHSRNGRLSPDEFVYLAISSLPPCLYEGAIHPVFSRFNPAFRAYFPDLDPVKHTKQMAEDNKIYMKPITGGVLISRTPFAKAVTPQEVLGAMGL